LIAKDWEKKKLKELALPDGLMVDGDWIESKDQDPNGEVRLIQLSDIGDGFFLNKSERFLTRKKADELRCIYLEPGDVLIARMPDPLGRSCVFPGLNQAAVTAVDVCILRLNNVTDRDWVKFYLNNPTIRREIFRRRSGTTRARISRSELEKLDIYLPPIQEQRRISEVLSNWDKVINLVGKQIETKRRLKRGLMQQVLTGIVRFPNFDDEWREISLGQFLKMKLRKVEKPDTAYLRLGVRSHGKGTFTTIVEDPRKVSMSHLYQVREGDLVVSITFAWEGAIAMVEKDGDFAHVSHRFPTYKFDTKLVVPEFFRYLMHTPRFFYDLGGVSPGGAGRNRVMSKRNFLKIKVKVPSVKEQKRIGDTLMTLDRELNLLEAKLEKLENEKQGLMQKLLTGEVRVKV